MIFVTSGTHEQPFPRLMQMAADLANRDQDVLVQYGYNTALPENCHGGQFYSFDEMRRLIADADAVITHGGTGSIMLCLLGGKKPIVVPRLQELGEHVDDHQLQISSRLQQEGKVFLVDKDTSVEAVLEWAQSQEAQDEAQLAGELPRNLDLLLSDIEHPPIVLYDGYCGLCSASIQFILKHDSRGVFRFASLQSALGQELLALSKLPADYIESLVLLERGRAYLKSGAALRIARKLESPWHLAVAGLVFPRFIRDAVYNFIANNRYDWFGRHESCWLPNPQWNDRFLDGSYEMPSGDDATANED